MNCKICSNKVNFVFEKQVLGKYNVKYYQCEKCLFIQTEMPYWIEEAYQNVITSLDIGLVHRNNYFSVTVAALLSKFFNSRGRFLDYGGGYGLFVRIMRDKGFDYFRQDKFCENLFAKNFDIENLAGKRNFEVVTAFELFEHLVDPIKEIEIMLEYGDSILFSTELLPEPAKIDNWEYLALETGQHIALYHKQTLQAIATKFNLNLYTNNHDLHLLTKKKINGSVYRLLVKRKIALLYNLVMSTQSSYLKIDYDMIKKELNRKQ